MVTMQTFQMAILLLFEDRDTIKYTEIHEMLQLNNDQFQKHINSLIECKLLLLDGDVSKLINNFKLTIINYLISYIYNLQT